MPKAISYGTFGHLRNTPTVALDWQGVTSYWCSIMTLGLRETAVELQAVKVSKISSTTRRRSPGIYPEPLWLRDTAKNNLYTSYFDECIEYKFLLRYNTIRYEILF